MKHVSNLGLTLGFIGCFLGLCLFSCSKLQLSSLEQSEAAGEMANNQTQLPSDTVYPVDTPEEKDEPGSVDTTPSSTPQDPKEPIEVDPTPSTPLEPSPTPAPTIPVTERKIVRVFTTLRAFAFLNEDGSLHSYGDSGYGGGSRKVDDGIKVTDVYSNDYVFAIRRENGSVLTWGNGNYGGAPIPSVKALLTNVVTITPSYYAFSALRSDGSVVVWGIPNYGGTVTKDGKTSNVLEARSNPVVSVVSTRRAFAALRSDGTVESWGDENFGGDSSCVSDYLSNVKALYGSRSLFTAIKNDGTAVVWGSKISDDGCPSIHQVITDRTVSKVYTNNTSTVLISRAGNLFWSSTTDNVNENFKISDAAKQILVNEQDKISQVVSNDYAYTVITNDGRAISFGDQRYGGNSSGLISNVDSVVAAGFAFSAIKKDGSVVAWGADSKGGSIDSCAKLKLNGTVKVKQLAGGVGNFAALREDSYVVSWGEADFESNRNEYTNGKKYIRTISGNALGFALIFSKGFEIWLPSN